MELTSIDGQVIFRMLPHGTERVFLWVPKGVIKSNSNHFRQYVARQHIDAGSDRIDGESGRDVVLVWADEIPAEVSADKKNEPLLFVDKSDLKKNVDIDLEEQKRPKKWTREYVKTYVRATYKETKKSDARLGIFCAVLQGAVMYGVNHLNVASNPSATFNWSSIAIITVFGGVVGMYSSTYQNWVYRQGTRADSEFQVRLRQTMKASTISVLYTFSIAMATSSLLSLFHFLEKVANIIGNAYGKTEVNQWAVILREKRADTKIFKVKVPFTKKEIDTGVNQGKINFQIYSQNVLIFLRSLDLLKVSYKDFLYGRYVFWASIPIVKRLTLWWAEKKHPEMAEKLELRNSWKNYALNPMALPKNLLKLFNLPLRAYNGVKNKNSFVNYVNTWEDRYALEEFDYESAIFNKASCQGIFARAF